MIKLIIQIPCKDEAEHLPATLADLPRAVPGFDSVEWLVVDDGSTDGTSEVARAHGVDHVVRLRRNTGLANAFQAGLDASLKLGADVIVNTDADNQYHGGDVERLVAPVVAGRADLVIGDRVVKDIAHFSPLKKLLQRLGSWVVRIVSSTDVPDSTSGFRAYTRDAALRVLVVTRYTYTLETIIQAGQLRLGIAHVPIRTNAKTRESRLFTSMRSYVRRNAVEILRIYAHYEPLRVFMVTAAAVALVGLAIWIRFAIFWLGGDGAGHVQSLVAGALLFNVAVMLAALGIIADLLRAQRLMVQSTHERVRRIELELAVPPSDYSAGR